MRRELLEWLVCPECQETEWRLESAKAGEAGVVETGWLECAGCEARYSITDGILDLLPEPDEAVLAERAGWERFLKEASEELEEAWILALPRIHERVSSNAGSIAHWKRQADNFFHLVDLLGLSGRERVLELGAGRCWASAYLSRLGCQVVALDVVRGRAAGGLETGSVYLHRGTPYFDRVLASMERLPFAQGTFDLVLSVASIHHSPLLDRVVREASGVLRPGGRLALTSEPCVRVFREKRVDNEETQAGISEHVYNVLDYRRAFAQGGLRPSFHVPGAVLAMLEEQHDPPGVGGLKGGLFVLARSLWRSAALRKVLRSQPANLLGLLFLEYGLTAVAEKPLEVETL
jgi:SAM-dependent methyltransferase